MLAVAGFYGAGLVLGRFCQLPGTLLLVAALLVLAAAGLVTILLRRGAAATRHLVWSVAVATALALPPLIAIAPLPLLAIGAIESRKVNVRLVAATHRNLRQLAAERKFREDLYYRINVLRIHLPPLRERVPCIEPLAQYLLAKLCRSMKMKVASFAPDVLEKFQQYPWPGNIRQLSNTIERAILMEDGIVIQSGSISLPEIDALSPSKSKPASLKLSADEEKEMISRALENNLWIQKDAARQLGITPRALNYRIKKLGLE